MKASLRRYWPALPAALILYLGLAPFFREYPRALERPIASSRGVRGYDSLLAFIGSTLDTGNPGSATGTPGSATAEENPFRPVRPVAAQAGAAARPKALPPVRRYLLKGTVGSNVATITNSSGQKLIVKVGDMVDSAQVLAIEPNRVILKDRAGKFDLFQEK